MSPARQSAWSRISRPCVVALAALVVPLGTAAQQSCAFGEGSGTARTERDPRGGNITRLETPHFECAEGVEIWSDSTVVYQVERLAILYGSVRYIDGQRELRTNRGRYFYEIGRFEAQGDVVVNNYEDGSQVQNGDLVYLRQSDTREIEEMTFTTGSDGVRPRATVYPKRAAATTDSLGGPDGTGMEEATAAPPVDDAAAPPTDTGPGPPPEAAQPLAPSVSEPAPVADAEVAEASEPEAYEVTGDRLYFRGDSYFDADGDVEIVRDSLFAFAESASYDGAVGTLLLERSARVLGSGYELVGRTIELASADDGSDEIRARRDALLTGDDLSVTSEQIVLHLLDGELERMVAVPLPEVDADSASVADSDVQDTEDPEAEAPRRPFAVSQDMELTADSLDMTATGGALDRILAAGNARSVSSTRDNLNVEELPELARHDWMEGDTIEVLLKPAVRSAEEVGAAEEDEEYEVDRIIARVSARSLYRLTPSDSTAVPGVDPPALSYIVANRITIFMIDGQADRVESVGQVTGWHLEPLSRPPEVTEDEESVDPTLDPTDSADPSPSGLPPVGANDRGDGAAPGAYLFPGL